MSKKKPKIKVTPEMLEFKEKYDELCETLSNEVLKFFKLFEERLIKNSISSEAEKAYNEAVENRNFTPMIKLMLCEKIVTIEDIPFLEIYNDKLITFEQTVEIGKKYINGNNSEIILFIYNVLLKMNKSEDSIKDLIDYLEFDFDTTPNKERKKPYETKDVDSKTKKRGDRIGFDFFTVLNFFRALNENMIIHDLDENSKNGTFVIKMPGSKYPGTDSDIVFIISLVANNKSKRAYETAWFYTYEDFYNEHKEEISKGATARKKLALDSKNEEKQKQKSERKYPKCGRIFHKKDTKWIHRIIEFVLPDYKSKYSEDEINNIVALLDENRRIMGNREEVD